ncbi:MAG: M20/M25/M40 family metallo-hydrolase [Solirubrobacteraceae bacterium]
MIDPWIASAAQEIDDRFERDLAALVAVSSPSGDARAAEEAVAVASLALPDRAQAQRLPCSSPDHAADLLVSLPGTGSGRLLLLGHLDTVVAHGEHRPLAALPGGDRLAGSGAIDMKGGVVLALGVLRALAARAGAYAEVALLLVVDEEWRTAPFAHAQRFAGWDGCLCFEAGERREGDEAVVVRRKAAGALRITAAGRAAHAGSAPEQGRNALLAVAEVARRLAALHAPSGADRLTVVPTVMRSGNALNVVPPSGELLVDVRADHLDAFAPVLAEIPESIDGVELHAEQVRAWPGMDTTAKVAAALEGASALAGRPIAAAGRGGASDASHLALTVPRTIDGLGPRGGGAHHPDEFVGRMSVRPRAEIALALARVLLGVETRKARLALAKRDARD